MTTVLRRSPVRILLAATVIYIALCVPALLVFAQYRPWNVLPESAPVFSLVFPDPSLWGSRIDWDETHALQHIWPRHVEQPGGSQTGNDFSDRSKFAGREFDGLSKAQSLAKIASMCQDALRFGAAQTGPLAAGGAAPEVTYDVGRTIGYSRYRLPSGQLSSETDVKYTSFIRCELRINAQPKHLPSGVSPHSQMWLVFTAYPVIP